MTTLTCLLDLARRQHGVISFAQLNALGCSRAAVRHLVATQRLVRVHRGVYALEGPLSPHGISLAAVARCGPDAVLSHLSAAALQRLIDQWPVRPHVTITRETGATGPRSIVVHRSKTVEVTRVEGIPTTIASRTIIDCAPQLGNHALKGLLRRGEHHGLDLGTLDRPGIPKNLRRLLDQYVRGSGLTANELEARFYEICVRAGLPRPEIQAWFPERRRVDFAWHEIRLIAETDGRQTHGTYIAFTDDRRRDRDHTIAGYATLRFTWTEVRHEPDLVARDLTAAHAARAA